MKLREIAITALLGLLVTTNAASIELTPENIKTLVGSGTWLIEHFSPYCGHCRAFAPDWKRLTEDLASLETENDFHFGTIDCTVQGDLCHEHGITGFPTVQLWENGEKIERYSGLNQYDPLTEYIYGKIKKSTKEETSLDNEEGEGKDVEEEEEEEEEEDSEAAEAELEAEEEIDEVETPAEIGLVLPNPEGISESLNDAKLREIAAGSVPWFVKFYAPWCGHCQALAPTWVELGSQMRNQVNIGEVNCVELPALCSEFGIQGFPTLKMFGHGKAIDYSGDRSLVSFSAFTSAHSGPSVKDVTANELVKYLTVKDVSLIYLYKDRKGDIPELIESIANEYLLTIPFYATQDEESFKKFNIAPSDLPTIIITKDNGYRMYSETHDFSKNTKPNRDALVSWIEKEQYPLISKLGPSNHKSILQGNLPVVLNIVSSDDAVSQQKFRNIASAWFKSAKAQEEEEEKKVIFAEMDRSMWRNYVLDKFNVKHESTSKIIIFDAPNYEYYIQDMNGNELSIDRPEGLYLSLKNLDNLNNGASILALHEKIAVKTAYGFHWIFKHWFISFIMFGLVGGFIYRYLTYHSPYQKRRTGANGGSVLPSFRPVNVDTHKD